MSSERRILVLLSVLFLGPGLAAAEPQQQPDIAGEREPGSASEGDPDQEWRCRVTLLCRTNSSLRETCERQHAEKYKARANAIACAAALLEAAGCTNWVIDDWNFSQVNFAAAVENSAAATNRAAVASSLWKVKFMCLLSDGCSLETTTEGACFCAAFSEARELVCAGAQEICDQRGCTIKSCCYTIVQRPCCPCR